MPTMSVELWDERGFTVLTTVNVICNEHQAQQLEKLKEIKRFLARKFPQGVSKNLPFELFKKYFLS